MIKWMLKQIVIDFLLPEDCQALANTRGQSARKKSAQEGLLTTYKHVLVDSASKFPEHKFGGIIITIYAHI